MPRRAARVCPEPGCVELITGDARLCEEHERERKRAHDAKRPSAAQRGYDAEWRETRKAYLIEYPHCVVCGAVATEVDHITPISEGGARLDWNNLQAMCKTHHSQKTVLEDGGFGHEG